MNQPSKIISGGQTGADQAGLIAAKSLGIETGGHLPSNCMTETGPNYSLVEMFGCVDSGTNYAIRTGLNVRDSDGTVRFARTFGSPGERCTLGWIRRHKKPYFDVDMQDPPHIEVFQKWILDNNIQVLNVAGNSESRAPGILDFVIDYLIRSLSR